MVLNQMYGFIKRTNDSFLVLHHVQVMILLQNRTDNEY